MKGRIGDFDIRRLAGEQVVTLGTTWEADGLSVCFLVTGFPSIPVNKFLIAV